jgi:hypothetical protein
MMMLTFKAREVDAMRKRNSDVPIPLPPDDLGALLVDPFCAISLLDVEAVDADFFLDIRYCLRS